MNGNATTLNNISASTAANTIIDTSAGAGTTALSILNHTTTIAATIKDGASKTVAVNLANLNGGVAAFALNSSNTFSGGLTLKHTVSGGPRLVGGSPVITVGTAGFITSSPFGRGAITIGEAATDRVGIYINADNATIANELIVNANNGTDVAGMAIRTEKAGIRVDGKVTVNASLSMGANSGTGYLTLTNVISGVGGVIMPAGGGTLNATLTGPNTYLGKTIVNKGTLSFNSIKNVGEGASALGAPTTVANGTIDLATTLQYTGAATSSDRIINLLGSCTVNNSGTGTLTLNGGFTGGANNNLLFRGGTTIVANGIIAHNGL